MGQGRSSVDLKIEVAQLSDPGRDPNKQINEDSCGYAETRFGHLCVLCDGMGGHYGGQEASKRAITTIFEQIEQAVPNATPAQALKYAVEVAARRVYELGGAADNKVRPGSTVVAMLMHDDGLDVAHVGDSRAYVIRSGQIYPLTRDHSMVQAMIDAGFITEEQAIGHPDANKITRALGMKPEVDVELRPEPMELFAGDVLLTASDGLTDLALSKDILGATRQALASAGIEHACQQLVRMANDRGGHDNITVQLVRVVQTAQRRTRTGATLMGEAPGAKTMEQAPLTPAMHGASAGAVPQAAPSNEGAPMSVRTHNMAQHGAPHAAGPHAAGPHAAGPHAAGPQSVGPTSIDHRGQNTQPMQTASTAHDGTSRTSHAALPAASPAYGSAPQGHAVGSLHLPPVPPAMNPGLAQTLETPKGLSDYRLDGVGGLQLPPASTRYVGQQAHTMQGAPAMGAHGMQAQQGHAGYAQGHAAPAGGWPQPAPMHAAAAGAWQGSPNPGLAITQNSDGARRSSEVDSMGRTGGNVLFLALAISFVAAVVVLLIVWLLFLR